MGLILSIETATKVCSAALWRDRQLLALKELFIDKSHSELLAVLIRDTLRECGYKMKDLEAIAVSKGPGSYTGLRIGVSTAKGMCYALDIPLIGVNTLEAMAAGVAPFNLEGRLLCPMLDARRMEVYCLIADNEGQIIMDTSAVVVDENAFADVLESNPVVFFGGGAAKCKSLLSARPGAYFVDDVEPSARFVGALAAERFEKGQFEDTAYFEPFYLKEFVARKPKARL